VSDARAARGRLAARIYGFALVTMILALSLGVVLVIWLGDPPWMRHKIAVVETLAEQLGAHHRDRAGVIAALPDALRKLDGTVAVYDRDGTPLWPPDGGTGGRLYDDELRRLADGGAIYDDDDRLIAPMPGHPDLLVVYVSDHDVPIGYLLIGFVTMLGVVLLGSLWFARRIARPLRELQTAVRAFGDGDTAARARLTDRGELGDVGRAFDDMADRVAQLLHAQRSLLADISHELRTPLARIRVAIELATDDPDAAREVLADVGIDLSEIDQIIDDLFTVVRLDLPGAGAALDKQPIAVAEVVNRSRERFAALYPGRVLELDAHAAATGIDATGIDADPVLIRRALDNLLDNAAKYSPADAPIRVRTDVDAERVVVSVVDRGCGMTADELARAFTPFWRADASRTRGTGGVGLGLALARRVARAHGGDVTLDSRPGGGTSAALAVPRATGYGKIPRSL
jgi:two-component system, OmpR family, sensor kinase